MSKPTIFFDHQIFDLQKVGGASRVFSEVISRLSPDFEGSLGVKSSRNLYLTNEQGVNAAPEAGREARISRLRQIAFRMVGAPVPTRLVDSLPAENRAFGLDLVERLKPDLLVPTYYDPYLLNLKDRPPVVATVLDMITERYPEFYLGDRKHSTWKEAMVKGCERIVAISQSTKNNLIALWGVPDEKISVVPLASSLVEDTSIAVLEPPVTSPYLLFVGERGRYKNFYFMLESLRGFLRKNPEWQVLCVGADFQKDERKIFETIGLNERIHSLSGSDEQVRSAYTHASCVVIPSLAEGFGLPVIEALALGCRVAASRIPVFQEIAENQVAYFDPKDPVELAAVVERECLRGKESEEEIERRKNFARKYTWDATTRNFEKVFQQALANLN